MTLTAFERETVITASDGDEYTHIWTAQAPVIRRLRKAAAEDPPRVEITGEGEDWLSARVPKGRWTPTGGLKRTVKMTDEQREAAAERLRRARNG